jgi:hypothetical protein
LTVRTPLPFIHADDWSACILDGMGEIVSICSCDSGVQIKYTVSSFLPVVEKMYVSIIYRGMNVFSSPVEICRAVFKNSGRLAFGAVVQNIIAHEKIPFSAMFDGSAVAWRDLVHGDTHIYEISGVESGYGNITYQLSHSIRNINGYKPWRLTNARSIIGFMVMGHFAEVSFDNVILRIFPFVNAYSFDICETADCMIVSFRDRMDVVIAKLSTGEVVNTIQRGQYDSNTILSPCGKFLSFPTYHSDILIYSVETCQLIKHMHFGNIMYVYQFASDETMLVYNYSTSIRSIVNIFTGEECEFLPGVDCIRMLPFIRGPYAYCYVDGKLCAYE